MLILIGALSLALMTASAIAIVSGERAPKTEPYDGSFQHLDSPRADRHVCGATLIAPRWAITAGHCTNWVDGRADTSGRGVVRAALSGEPVGWRVRFGSLSTRAGGRLVAVKQFVRMSRSVDPTADLALLRLARPVHARVARLATRTPRPGARALILGWGYTGRGGSLADFASFTAYPRKLREATTQVWPGKTCGLEPDQLALCVGGAHGRPNPDNMDSGGPVFVRQPGAGIVLAGTVNGGNYTGHRGPSVYTDVSKHLKWIRSYLSGRRTIPRERPLGRPGLAGTASFGGCAAAVVRVASSRPTDRALLLGNGHCADPRPPRGKAFADRPAAGIVTVNGASGNAIARTSATRLLYATMTGTDVAVYRLAATYAELAEAGVRPLRLAESGPTVGERLEMLSGGAAETTLTCRVAAVVPVLREAGYEQREALRYAGGPDCEPEHGMSGSPLVDPSTREVVAIHNTHVDGDGEPCSENNPCEVAPDGTVTAIKGRGYAQQTAGLTRCIVAGSRFDLAAPGCSLTADLAK